MAERLGSGEIEVRVAGDASAELRRIEAEFKRTMAKIDSSRAEAEVGADLGELKRDLAEAKAMLKKYEAESARLKKVNLDNYSGAVRKQYEDQKRQNAALLGQERKRVESLNQIVRVRSSELDRMKAVGKETDRQYRADQAALKLAEQRHRAQVRLTKEHERAGQAAQKAATASARELDQVARLEKAYARAVRQHEKLQLAKTPRGREAKIELEIDRRGAVAKLELIKAELSALGRKPPVGINVDVKWDDRARQAFFRGMDKLSALPRAFGATRIALGPISASVRTFGLLLAGLAPVITGVIGTLGALIAVVGSAAAGVGALAIGFGAAFIPAAIGAVAVLKPLVQQLHNINQIQTAYNKAVLKYGADSKQAKKAHEQLTQAMKGTDQATVRAFEQTGKLGAAWNKMTKPATASALHAIGTGIRTVAADLGVFGRGTNKVFAAADKSITKWARGLRSTEARGIFRDLFANAAATIGPLSGALGNLVTWLGRVGRVASSFLPGIAKGFERWSSGLADSAKNSSKVHEVIADMLRSLSSVGRLLVSTGKFLVSFFAAGVKPGRDLADTMTHVLDGWTRFNRSVEGKNKIASFFKDSVANTSALVSALAPLGVFFVNLASDMSPIVTGMLQGVTAVGKFVHALTNLLGLGGGLKALGFAFGVAFAVGKIQAAAGAMLGLARAIGLVKKVQIEAAAVSAATGAAGGAATRGAIAGDVAGGALAGRAARGFAKDAEKAAVKGGLLRKVFGSLAGAGAGAGLAINPWVAGAVALGAAFYLLRNRTKSAEDQFKSARDTADKAAKSYRDNGSAVADLGSQQQRANLALRDAKKALDATKAGTDEHKRALLDYRDAQRQVTYATNDFKKAKNEQIAASNAQLAGEQKALTTYQQKHAAERRQLEDIVKYNASAERRAEAQKRLDILAQKEVPLRDRVTAAVNRQAAMTANLARSAAGMIPVAGAAEQALGRLAQAGQRASATKIALKFSAPQDVARVAASATKAATAGVSQKVVMKIIADSSDATSAIRRLQAARLDPKVLGILQKGGEAAVGMLRQIQGRKLTRKEQQIAQKGGPAVLAMVGRILGIKIPNKNFTVTANDNASGALRSIQALLNGINSKTVTLTTVKQTIGGGLVKKRARGRAAAGSERALVGEGGGPEMVANQRTGLISKVDKPTIMDLSKDDFVIPTESAHKMRGAGLMADFAKALGIPGFAGGRGPKTKNPPASNKALAGARKDARAQVKKSFKGRSGDAKAQTDAVAAAKQKEADQEFEINRAVGKLKEPDTFLKVVGQDEQGNDLYQVDQGAIDGWKAQLNGIRDMFNTLLKLIQDTANAIAEALRVLGDSKKGIIGSTTRNKTALEASIEDEDHIINHSKSKASIQKAKARKAVYKEAWTKENERQKDAFNDRKDMQDEQHDVEQRRLTAMDSRDEYQADADAVQGRAEKDQQASVPKPPKPEAPAEVDPFAALTGAGNALEAEAALTAIGQGTRSQADIIKDQIANQQAIINLAKGMLTDTNPENDQAAYAAITGAAGQIQSLQGTQPNLGNESTSLGTARGDLFRSMGGNFALASGFGGISAATMPGPGFAMGTAGGGGPVGGGGGTTVNVVNNYKTMPLDPHTWSKNLLFELQAAS